MDTKEIDIAASNAAAKNGAERIKYVESFPKEHWLEILQLARLYNAESDMFRFTNIGRDII